MTMSLFVQITVKDFDEWKKVYDSGTQLKKDNGVIRDTCHRHPDNPNSVMIYHQFADESSLNSFFALMEASEEIFKEAGVLTSEVWYGEDVAQPI